MEETLLPIPKEIQLAFLHGQLTGP